MSIKSLYPDTRPSLNLDFANTKVLDPRITFARASTATYYDGKTVSKAEENLSLYSQQFNAWSSLDITLTADADIAPDGTQTAYKSVPNGTNTRHISYLSTNATINNLPYTYSAYFKAAGYNFAQLGLFLNSSGVDAYIIIDLTNGSVTQSAGNTGVRGTFTYSVQSVGNGWYRGVITCGNVTGMSWAQGIILAASNSGTPSLAGAGSPTFSGDGTSGILIWGAQMEQRSSVTAYTPTTNQRITRYAPTLLTAPTNSPRFDHDPTTGEGLGLLIEEQRTNLFSYSQNIHQAWVTSALIYRQEVVAPDGTLTAWNYMPDTGGGYHYAYRGWNVTNGQTYTISFYAKRTSTTSQNNIWSYPVSTGGQTVAFNLLTGVASLTSYLKGMEDVGNGWWRCWYTFTHTGTTGSETLHLFPGNPGTYTGDGYSGISIWGFQVELGAFKTSYISSPTSEVTRSADSASMTGTNFTSWYNNTQGALHIESQNDYNSSTVSFSAGTGVEIHSGAFQSNLFAFNSKRDSLSYTSPWFNIFAPGGAASVIGNGIIGGGSNRISGSAFYKSSFSWSFGNTLATSADGTTTASASLGLTSPPIVTTLGFAANLYAYDPFNGRIKKLTYYPKSLTNTQLQALTQP